MAYDYAIVANGDFLIKEILAEVLQDKIIIALDGAVDRLAALDFKIDILLGDFDSISPASHKAYGIAKPPKDAQVFSTPYLGKLGVNIVPASNQNHTDLEKALIFCQASNARQISIVCALGGRMDLEMSNIFALRKSYSPSCPILLYAEQQIIRFAKDETLELTGEVGDKCGIFPFPQAVIAMQGLEYSAQRLPLFFADNASTANSLITNSATITVRGEALLIMPPGLMSQQQFAKLSPLAQMQRRLRDLTQISAKE
jgi:thiamine pyrophosphokinase